ncbi:MAG: U32 family peptidase, partial [Clostridia bacterium]|nr:U32 family peptidase [Clostridia bacterium]
VFSFKIEGRICGPEYVSAAVNYYSKILNGTVSARDLSNLKRTYNRGNYTRGLAFGQDKRLLSSAVQGHIGEFVGVIKIVNGKFLCQCNEKYSTGDGFKILRDGKEVGGAVFAENVKGGFVLLSKTRLKNGDKVFITTDTTVNENLLKSSRKINVRVKIKLVSGDKPTICLNGEVFTGENKLSEAKSRPLTIDDIKNCFNKTDKYPFNVHYEDIDCCNVFMAASELNSLRREAYGYYFDKITKSTNIKYSLNHTLPVLNNFKSSKVAAICTDLSGNNADIGVLKLSSYDDNIEDLCKSFNGKKFLYLPPYVNSLDIEKIKNIADKFDGLYCEGIYGFCISEELNMPLFVGTGLNISNAVDLYECEAEYIALSKELTVNEANALSRENTFYLTCGNIKVMDLIYCPFEKRCSSCDRRDIYTLTDENGREFPVRRYRAGSCRFEIYNCANLVSAKSNNGSLLDLSVENNPQKIVEAFCSGYDMTAYFKNRTRGHSIIPIN